MLRCSTTADFLAALPFATGFTAENSLFAVLFRGRRSSGAIRLDLPDPHHPEAVESLLDALCLVLRETGAGAERPALVLTSAQTFAESGGTPWRGFAHQLRRRIRREGWSLRELAVVAPDGWAGLLHPDDRERQRPLDEISTSPIGIEAARCSDPPQSLSDLGSLPEPDSGRAAAVAARLAELDRREALRREHPGRGEPIGPPAWLHGAVRVAGACFEKTMQPADPRLCARLIRAAEDPDRWLLAVLTALTRPEFVIGVAQAGDPSRYRDVPVDIDAGPEPGPEHGWSIRRLLFALADQPPDADRLRRVAEALGDVAAHAPAERRAGLLTMLAWTWWMLGLPSIADRLTAEVLSDDPENELARMVSRLCAAPPCWRLTAARSGVRGSAHPGARDPFSAVSPRPPATPGP